MVAGDNTGAELMALERQPPVFIPLATGVVGKVDPRALKAPGMSICRNAQFDDLGGTQVRLPYDAMPMDILGGGVITAPTKLAVRDSELVLFSGDRIYSWSEHEQSWIDKGEHRAITVEEEPRFVRTEEQVACDRAEMGGVIVYVWQSIGTATEVQVAAIDKETGAVLLTPTSMGAASTRPRLLALTTRILLFFELADQLRATSIDIDNLATSVASSTVLVATEWNARYDVCRSTVTPANALVVFRRDTTTSYGLLRVPEGITGFTATTKARPLLAGCAIASAPSGDRLAIIRSQTVSLLQADVLVESTFADSTVSVVMGSVPVGNINEIAAAFKTDADGGTFRCYAFWSDGLSSIGFSLLSNFITATGTAGSAVQLIQQVDPVSRAFAHDGDVYLWAGYSIPSVIAGSDFKSAQQNTNFLIRHDGIVMAHSIMFRAGGQPQVLGRLPQVQDLGGGRYAYMGEERRLINIGRKPTGYAAREPVDVVFTFSDDRARRTVQLGKTLYVAGSPLLQYDGEALAEVGFPVAPGDYNAVGSGAGSPLLAGTYGVAYSWSWQNAQGERDRSTIGALELITITAAQEIRTTTASLSLTRKSGARSVVSAQAWRSPVNPSPEADLFLVSSNDPAVNAGDNRYIANSTSSSLGAFDDALSDADLILREAFPENGTILDNTCPQPCTIVVATQDRLIATGMANHPNRIDYSLLRTPNAVASFNGNLSVELPPIGGRNTALGFLQETLVCFQETACFALPNDGFNNDGSGTNYGPGRLISSDIGAVSQEAVAFTPLGLFFKSAKGWYVMADWGAPRYVGQAVADFDSDEVKSIVVVESQHQVRVVTDQRMLMWDYAVNEWSEWPLDDGLDAVLWQGQHVIATDAGVFMQAETPAGVQLDLEMGWIKTSEYQRIWELQILGEFRSACRLRVRLSRDHQEGTYFQDKIWTVTPTTVGGPLRLRHRPSIQQCQALKVRLTVLHATLDQAPVGEGVRLTGIALEYGQQPGLFKRLPAAQSQ
jgi:hypothetical protein